MLAVLLAAAASHMISVRAGRYSSSWSVPPTMEADMGNPDDSLSGQPAACGVAAVDPCTPARSC